MGVSSRRSCMSSENHSTSASSALLVGHRLDYCDMEWFALEMNRDHSVIFEVASKYCISDSLLTMMATPFLLRISLTTVVDIMVI